MIVNDAHFDAVFTSANFEIKNSATYGPTFSVVSGRNTVSDRLVELIWSANHSIKIASGHLRSRPVSKALLERKETDPLLDIVVYLDGQEYISYSGHTKQTNKMIDCLESAGDSESKRQSCLDKGFLYSYALQDMGIDLRYKYYSYRWHYSYAAQMHHKYMIIDDETVVSGSYNLSDNAEHNTMENIAIYHSGAFGELVESFVNNFDQMWVTGDTEALYESLMNEIEHGTSNTFPIVFDAMALNWSQVTALKAAIRENCPLINSEDYRKHPEDHWFCERN
jgi:phosphatidylserine/phosphatidylglycerophosphate/cardiolipin synthase-like enzyme